VKKLVLNEVMAQYKTETTDNEVNCLRFDSLLKMFSQEPNVFGGAGGHLRGLEPYQNDNPATRDLNPVTLAHQVRLATEHKGALPLSRVTLHLDVETP